MSNLEAKTPPKGEIKQPAKRKQAGPSDPKSVVQPSKPVEPASGKHAQVKAAANKPGLKRRRGGPDPVKPTVVALPVRPPVDVASKNKKKAKRSNWLGLSALAVIALPTLLVGVYLAFVASERYAVEAQFAVRGQDVPMLDAAGLMGAFGGAPTQTTSDSYIVTDYLLSRPLVAELDRRLDLQAIYAAEGIDFLSRYRGSEAIEELTSYWQQRTSVHFDPTKNTIRLEVTAFDGPTANRIAGEALLLAGALVNRLSEESRSDALRGATEDVERAEFRLRVIREEMQHFREQESIADPVASAGSAQELIAELQGQIARIETELSSARTFLNDDAPSIRFLSAQKAALDQQLATARAAIGASEDSASPSTSANPVGSIASMISGFEELEIERQFAQQAYTAALASLERARAEADRKQRYLAVFVEPRAPDIAAYPLILRNVLLALVLSALAWVIGVLLFYGVREHTG